MLRLTLIEHGPIPIEADAIVPDRLAGMTLDAIVRSSIFHGNREVRLGDLFRVEGDTTDGRVEIFGDCSRLKGLGRGMTSGHLLIHGNAGMHLGAEMTGGRLDVFGDAGNWLGAEIRGGLIHVHGQAGNLVGAAYRGGTKGMRGGVILIDGDAGDEVGAGMRRGLIAVGGRCGDMAGVSMIAGSLIAFGGIGCRAGAGMKRGSIVVLKGPVELPPTFRLDCDYRPAFLAPYWRQLSAWGFRALSVKSCRLFRRFSGDLLSLGKGEILVAVAD